MRYNHDPLVPRQRRKKPGETPDETEQRHNADLQAFMNDERYQKDDGEFRHFVQRQFRRVYDDPSGKPAKNLTIGRPKTYVTDLEPFDRRREAPLRRETEARDVQKSEGAKARQGGTAGSVLSEASRIQQAQTIANSDASVEEEHDINPYWAHHPSISPDFPEGREGDESLEAGLDTADATFEQRCQAA